MSPRMMPSAPIRSKARPPAIPQSEQGYVLLIAIFLMALLVISLAVAAPKIARSIQRDRDLETFHRGMQYRRAIQLYYRKFHAYPPNVDALVNTNDIRFLRKKYLDPITGQDDWKPIAFGQNKTPTAMGFFGQPLAGNASTLAGIGPAAAVPAWPELADSRQRLLGGGGFSLGSLSPAHDAITPDNSDPAQPAARRINPGSTSSGGAIHRRHPPALQQPAQPPAPASPAQPSAARASSASEPASPKQSILVYKKKNHYNEWEFTYDPLSDMKTIGGGSTGLNGQPAEHDTSTREVHADFRPYLAPIQLQRPGPQKLRSAQ